MNPIVRVFSYLKKFPVQIFFHIFFNILYLLFNLGSYVMIVPFVQLMFSQDVTSGVEPQFGFSQQQIADWAFWHLAQYKATWGLWKCLLATAIGYLACSLISNLFRYISFFFLATVRNGLMQHIRNDLYYKITVLPVSYFKNNSRGDLISRMGNDISEIEWSALSALQSLIKDPINIIVFSFTLIFVSWRLFVIFLIVLPIGIWIVSKIGKSLKRNSVKGQNKLGVLFANLEESLSYVKTIKLFRQEQRRKEQFEALNHDYTKTMVKVARRKELSSPLSEILGTLALVFILIVGGWQVIDGYILPSVFIFFVIVFARLVPPLQSIVKAYNSMQKGAAASQRVWDVIDADEKIVEKENAPTLKPFTTEIRYNNVGFEYVDGKPVLKDINLTIRKGMTIAVVGRSGSGKSTMVDLLPRFYDCTQGSITIDGTDIRNVRISSLRSMFGIVSQECILFNDTVANNISFGSTQYTIEQIRAAAKLAYADEFIEQLPQGYDTIIGDRGMNLSGGQRQRLSIARAVLRNPACLILDEATSALDSEAETLVQKGLDALSLGRTCITIAHRLSTIRNADLIVVVDEGRIVEQGTHTQLLEKEGVYSTLVKMQSK